jgi:hypothetical protein
MTFGEALKKLDIEDYEQRIVNSNSHGEMFHLLDYIAMAEHGMGDGGWFRTWFIEVVKWAETHWKRPESVFQHMPKIIAEMMR